MRYALLFSCVAAFVWIGCQPEPPHQVELAAPPAAGEPAADKPKLTEIRPIESTIPGEDKPAGQATPTLSEVTQGRPYTVRKHDTYWKIAARQLGNGQRWKDIEALNPGVDKTKLRVGQTIRIPVK